MPYRWKQVAKIFQIVTRIHPKLTIEMSMPRDFRPISTTGVVIGRRK